MLVLVCVRGFALTMIGRASSWRRLKAEGYGPNAFFETA